MTSATRRGLLVGGASLGVGAAVIGTQGANAQPQPAAAPHMAHGGGVNGATFRAGAVVDHEANGFHPTEILRDFDYGTTSVMADGRVLREWEIYAVDTEIEVAPGVRFPAWTFNSRVPGPTLRCRQGDRLRVRFINGSAHPHTMHFHGIHPADMDGVPGVGAGIIEPGDSFTYEFDAEPFGLHLYHCHAGPLAAWSTTAPARNVAPFTPPPCAMSWGAAAGGG